MTRSPRATPATCSRTRAPGTRAPESTPGVLLEELQAPPGIVVVARNVPTAVSRISPPAERAEVPQAVLPFVAHVFGHCVKHQRERGSSGWTGADVAVEQYEALV